MKIKLSLALVLSLVIMTRCQHGDVDLQKEEATIMKTDSEWAALASGSKDVEKIVSYWSDDAIVLSPGEKPVQGKEALRKMVSGMSNISGFNINWKSRNPHFSPDGKMAYMYGENIISMNDSAGNKITIPGRGYTIWKKESDGNWKCVVDIWNSPPMKK